jgi:hypothetical protein
MTADLTSFETVLTQTALAYRQNLSDRMSVAGVVNSLLEAEKAAKKQKLTYSFESLLGQWQLCFATGTKKVRERGGIVLGKGFYLPKLVKAYISFSLDLEQPANRGFICNSVHLGSIILKLTGPAQYPGKKNLLVFDFTYIEISLFGRVVYSSQIRGGEGKQAAFYNQGIGKLPFFAFFLVTSDLIAARGRGGGLALWIREN